MGQVRNRKSDGGAGKAIGFEKSSFVHRLSPSPPRLSLQGIVTVLPVWFQGLPYSFVTF